MVLAALRLVAVTTLVAAMLGGCVTSPDRAMSSRLVGKWSHLRYFDEKRVEDATEIHSDGTLDRRGVIRDVTGSRTYTARGVWHIENAVYHEKIEWSDFPGWKPGPETAQAMVSVSDWEWVMKEAPTGAEIRFWRYPQ